MDKLSSLSPLQLTCFLKVSQDSKMLADDYFVTSESLFISKDASGKVEKIDRKVDSSRILSCQHHLLFLFGLQKTPDNIPKPHPKDRIWILFNSFQEETRTKKRFSRENFPLSGKNVGWVHETSFFLPEKLHPLKKKRAFKKKEKLRHKARKLSAFKDDSLSLFSLCYFWDPEQQQTLLTVGLLQKKELKNQSREISRSEDATNHFIFRSLQKISHLSQTCSRKS